MDTDAQIKRIMTAKIWGYDIDGTLIKSLPVIFSAFNDYTSKHYGVNLDEDFVRKHIMPGTAEEMIEQFAIHLKEVYDKNLEGEISDDIPKWMDAYEKCDVLPEVHPGAVQLLGLSKELGKKVPLITSGLDIEVEKNIRALEIAQDASNVKGDLWDTIVSYNDLNDGPGKPELLPMRLAFAKMGLKGGFPQDRVMYVGDSIGDMEFALNLNGIPVFVTTTLPEKDLHEKLDDSSSVLVFSNVNQLYQELLAHTD